MPFFYGKDEGVSKVALRGILKDLMLEVQKHTEYAVADVIVLDNVREAYVRTATPPVLSAALLGCWPYLPLSVQRTFLPTFLTFPVTRSISGWLGKSMFCSIQTVLFGSLAAESVAEHAWYKGLKVAVESQTKVGASITTLLGQHAPDSLLLKNIPATAQPLFPSVDVDWPSDPPQAASDTGQQLQPPSTASPDQPSRRGRGAGVALEAGRVNVRFEDVPEYVLFAMITKQVEARVPVEELRSLDPKRRRQLRSVPEVTVATPDSHTAAEPTPPDAWGDGMAASNDSEEPPAAAAGGDVVGDAVAGAGGGGAMERRRMRTLPPPPTAEELARREEEAAWGWSEAGEAAERPAAGTASQRRRQHAAAAEAGGPPNATLADEWTDAFPEDVPRTSDDWSAAEEGAVRRRGRNREHIGDAVTVLPRAVPASPWL